MSFLCGGVNYHVEHHDFVRVPVKDLHKVNKLSKEFYNNLISYKGCLDFYKTIINSSDHSWFYACQNHFHKQNITINHGNYTNARSND